MEKKIINKIKRIKRVRVKILAHSKSPRLSIFRSNRNLYAQIIDDRKSITLASISSLNIPKDKKQKKSDMAKALGKKLAETALKKKIKSIVFDRGGYKYHGLVKALAEGAREGGLKF
jgi:large subunit ribosomal protein L18